jgi:hypothetical protein
LTRTVLKRAIAAKKAGPSFLARALSNARMRGIELFIESFTVVDVVVEGVGENELAVGDPSGVASRETGAERKAEKAVAGARV